MHEIFHLLGFLLCSHVKVAEARKNALVGTYVLQVHSGHL